ncbi:MAG TPA: histidine kinase N-terminal 7TM domain-containing protein [Anaerolineales bacterium]
MSFHTLALLINIGIVAAVGAGAFRRRGTSGAAALIVFCALVALWTASYIMLGDARLTATRSYTSMTVYLTALLTASVAFWIILVRTNRRRWLSRRSVVLFAVLPVLTVAVFGLIPGRGALLEPQAAVSRGSLFPTGPWEPFIALYVFVMVLAGALLLLDAFFERHQPFISSLTLAFAGALLAPVVLIVEFAGRSPFTKLEVLPFAFGLCSVGFLYGLFDRRPEEIGAIDRHAAVEGMDEGWIVLDVRDTVVDMNPAAERMTGYTRDQVYGKPISSLLGDISALGLTLNTSEEVEMKRSIRLEEGWRYLNIRISTLMDPERTPFGRLTLWRDMTERKLSEDSRQRSRDEMFVMLNAISSAASNTLNTTEFLLESIYQIIYPFRSQVVGIFLIDDKGKRRDGAHLQLASHLGMPAEAIEELADVQASSPLFHWVMDSRQPIHVTEAENDERVPAAIRRIPVECVVMLPLVAQGEENGKFLGSMLLARKEKSPFSQDEIVRLTTLSDHIASLIDSDRRRKLAIALTERERLMRDLHDSVSQKLYGLVTTTEAAQAAMEAGSSVDPRQEFARIGEHARQAVKEMRLFLYQMQQVDVEKEGLISVLHQRLSAVEGRADIKARLLTEEEEIQLSTEKQMALYYIAQEALNNVLRHAHAKSVLVTLRKWRGHVVLEISDDGVGFDPKKVDRAGLGLRNMKARAEQLDGKVQIISKPEGGTRILVAVPLDPGLKSETGGRE